MNFAAYLEPNAHNAILAPQQKSFTQLGLKLKRLRKRSGSYSALAGVAG